ncbi:MAG TPA: bifunctional ornithine acetyltransferase/N-acetylglutamate synthase, partial [Candidatus Omnitrophota bacterium]|nr:bifunctional ornithine acetyltransferase/N-acetylglutamate synthase [Candidatus Omnitrophota bacterium]
MKIKLPKGFKANGMHCGLKKKRKDLALFYSVKPAKCAALFTSNLVKAAPVVFCQKQLAKTNCIRAIIANSGNANCMTGERGLKDAKRMAKEVAREMHLSEKTVLVSSTGVIGRLMNMDPVIKGIPHLVKGLSEEGIIEAAEGIMTTDRFYKISSRTLNVKGKKVTIVGVAKGAGMINPNMATMLAYIMTDVNISEKALRKALTAVNEDSFNAITVDGDMSTNDTVVLLANGAADNRMV